MKENEICGTGINAILTLLILRIPCFSLTLGDCSLPNISASIFANIFRTLIDKQEAISCISSNQHGKLSLSFLQVYTLETAYSFQSYCKVSPIQQSLQKKNSFICSVLRRCFENSFPLDVFHNCSAFFTFEIVTRQSLSAKQLLLKPAIRILSDI